MNITLPYWYDLHVHFRQGDDMGAYIQAHLDMKCAGALAMPNTKPPISRVLGGNTEEYWTIEGYRQMIEEAGGDRFEHFIVPLYLTKETTPAMIEEGAKSGLLQSCKYYPPHGTTNADFGAPMQHYIDNGVLQAMADNNVVLNIHGEQHGMEATDYFDKDKNAEDYFYKNVMPQLVETFPNLKIACEHITTKTAANFVQQTSNNVAATITPQHLLYTVGDLLKGCNYHLYCLPLVKFEEDRKALLDAIQSDKNDKFFAGTDSAPHHEKVTECSCAAGCFTGEIAPQLYAQAFDLNDDNKDQFEKFLCLNGPKFYGIKPTEKRFTLVKKEANVKALKTNNKDIIPLPLGMGQSTIPWSIE